MEDKYIKCSKCGEIHLKDEYKVEVRIITNSYSDYYCVVTGYYPNEGKINKRMYCSGKIKHMEDEIEEFKEDYLSYLSWV